MADLTEPAFTSRAQREQFEREQREIERQGKLIFFAILGPLCAGLAVCAAGVAGFTWLGWLAGVCIGSGLCAAITRLHFGPSGGGP